MHFFPQAVSAWLFLSTAGYVTSTSAAFLQRDPIITEQSVLYPALHPEHDSTLINHLLPNSFKTLYYSQEGHGKTRFGTKHAEIHTNFNERTVLLEHSNFIKSVSCSPSRMHICFKSSQAFGVAEETWNSDGANLIIGTYHAGCGNTVDGTRSFFMTNRFTFDAKAKCVGMPTVELAHEEAMKDIDLTMGTYRPTNKGQPFTIKRTHPGGIHPSRRNSHQVRANTVDLTTDFSAAEAFFNVVVDNASGDPPGPDPNQPIATNGTIIQRRRIEKRYFGQNLVEIFVPPVVQYMVRRLTDNGAPFEDLYNRIKNGVQQIGKYVREGFHHEFTPTYKDVFVIDVGKQLNQTSQEVAKPSTAIFGLGEGLSLGNFGADFSIQCIGCGATGRMHVDAHIAFSIADGLKSGSINVELDPTKVVVQFGVTLDVKASGEKGGPLKEFKLEEQIFATALSPLGIPNIFFLGPGFSVNAALNLALEGSAQILVGGTLNLAAGGYHYDMLNSSTNGFHGLEPTFDPVAKANGSLTLTVDMGLPVKLEFGINIFRGKFQQTAALVEHPSVYGSVTVANNNPDCNGFDFKVGLKNRIYLAFPSSIKLLDNILPTYEFLTNDFPYPLGCLTFEGIGKAVKGYFSPKTPEPKTHPPCPPTSVCDYEKRRKARRQLPGPNPNATSPYAIVNETFTNGTYDQPYQKINNLTIPSNDFPVNDKAYRILMDPTESVILVSGNDEYLYIAPANNSDYDVSTPFGTVNGTQENVLVFDVFGRLLNYDPAHLNTTGVSLIKTTDPTVMPTDARGLFLVEIREDSQGLGLYAARGVEHDSPLALVFCSIENDDTKVLAVDMNSDLGSGTGFDGLKGGSMNDYVGGTVQDCDVLELTSQDYDGIVV